MRSRYVNCLGREMHVTEWGDANAPTVIAWHGLARSGRDFDDFAAALSARWHIVCPDTPGRGLSQWAIDPAREYCLAFYVEQAEDLLDQLGLDKVHWVGTSMGGAIGTLGAATRLRGRIRRLVLNDNGPELAAAALARIQAYAGQPPSFATVSALEAYFREIYASFGHLSDTQWRHLTETSLRRLPDGRVTPHYDPALVQQFEHHPDDYALWAAWDELDLPVLCLRGEDSTLLTAQTAQAMRERGPRAAVAVIPGCGHAPALNTPEQIGLIERFLSADGATP
ncbi:MULTISPECIES: alpha/beta fold hydrolase [Roseateles]|uniref:Pimeloyl-ACP methyl ester carboxylesterase n=1 Tax=Pelomonas aquatica TaxID=431058 RepID=A0ABU1ZDF1_9BURK|nr:MULTISPECIES: alpha/beta hydrolase [Roseateles]KQY87207.1 hydrolase [Pelomonas sp. Root1444]MDR7298661.1 pimeloyl-ACP methyl ester carboxylesterase [Pelomonas aquatica]